MNQILWWCITYILREFEWSFCSRSPLQLIQIETSTNLFRHVHHLFKASWRRCPHFPSNVTGAWSNHSANMCNNPSWGWHVFNVIFERFFPVGHIIFQLLLLVKSLELRQSHLWPPKLERILYTMVISSLSVEVTGAWSNHTVKMCHKSRVCHWVWYIFDFTFVSCERHKCSIKIQASPLETWKWSCYEES
jgi:hypothetical protein